MSSNDIELWIDDDGWALETVEGESIASGQTTEYQDRIPIEKILQDCGYEIHSVDAKTEDENHV